MTSHIKTLDTLGEQIRQLRESKGILLRQVAAYLEIDTALMSKLERGERKVQKEHVVRLAKFFHVNEKELITQWLCEKILDVIENEPMAESALKMAIKNIEIK
jgi:transcriptional regulator with XRE-family HTH domain